MMPTAVTVSASRVRIDMLMAPVARFAAMKTGNRLRLTAANISDLGGFRLQAETRAIGAEEAGTHVCMPSTSDH